MVVRILIRTWADPGQPDLSHDLGDRLLRDLLTGSPQVRGDARRSVGPAGVAMVTIFTVRSVFLCYPSVNTVVTECFTRL